MDVRSLRTLEAQEAPDVRRTPASQPASQPATNRPDDANASCIARASLSLTYALTAESGTGESASHQHRVCVVDSTRLYVNSERASCFSLVVDRNGPPPCLSVHRETVTVDPSSARLLTRGEVSTSEGSIVWPHCLVSERSLVPALSSRSTAATRRPAWRPRPPRPGAAVAAALRQTAAVRCAVRYAARAALRGSGGSVSPPATAASCSPLG